MAHSEQTDRETKPEVEIIEEWDTAAHMKYHYKEKAALTVSYTMLFFVLAIVAVALRGFTLWLVPNSVELLVGTRALMFVASFGIFGTFGAALYYQWRSKAIDSTITYKLEHPNGTQEDITEREVAAISLGYERDYFDDAPDDEVPCPRCLEVHD